MWMNTNQAAAYLGLHPETLRDKARAKKIPRHRLGGRWKFKREELDNAIREDDNASWQEARQGILKCHVNQYNSGNAGKSGITRSQRQAAKEYADLLQLQTKTKPKN